MKTDLDDATVRLVQDKSSYYFSPTLESFENEGCVRIDHKMLKCWSVPGVGLNLKFEVTVRDQTNAASRYATMSYADPTIETVELFQSSSNAVTKIPNHWHEAHQHCSDSGYGCLPAMQEGRPQAMMSLRLVGKNFGIFDDLSEVRYFMESTHSSGRITPLSATFVQVNLFADPLKFDEASKAFHDKYFFSGPNKTVDKKKLVRVRCPEFEAAATRRSCLSRPCPTTA